MRRRKWLNLREEFQTSLNQTVEQKMIIEVSNDDIRSVLTAHNVTLSEKTINEVRQGLDMTIIEMGALAYDTIDDRILSILDDIEDELMILGIITGEKLFNSSYEVDITEE